MSLDLPSKANPATGNLLEVNSRNRIPMSVPKQKLSVPDIAGFHLHWMLGTQERLTAAQRAGYQFVNPAEVNVPNHSIAGDRSESGNTDIGSLVSISAGSDVAEGGQPVRLILMKLPQEWWEEDQRKLEESSDRLAAALRAGKVAGGDGETETDKRLRYVGNQNRNMFQRRR